VNLTVKRPRLFGTSKVFLTFYDLSLWRFTLALYAGIFATSRHIPGVRFAGVSHPGLIGTAPSAELLATWNRREGQLIAECGNCVPAVAFPPEPVGSYVGQDLGKDVLEKIGKEGARTIPGREHGGNCDVCFRLFVDFVSSKLS